MRCNFHFVLLFDVICIASLANSCSLCAEVSDQLAYDTIYLFTVVEYFWYLTGCASLICSRVN